MLCAADLGMSPVKGAAFRRPSLNPLHAPCLLWCCVCPTTSCAAPVLLLPQLWDRQGNLVRQLASLPLAEDIPIAFNSCRTGGREGGRTTAFTTGGSTVSLGIMPTHCVCGVVVINTRLTGRAPTQAQVVWMSWCSMGHHLSLLLGDTGRARCGHRGVVGSRLTVCHPNHAQHCNPSHICEPVTNCLPFIRNSHPLCGCLDSQSITLCYLAFPLAHLHHTVLAFCVNNCRAPCCELA